ncbi:hypothetical protein ES288_D04G106600v1 [Gossypium darwinii]|uniref:PH domain-containing protein n=1 Tax=Gossypium darwinii TaxID=34276 RepID=A0A5D2CW02_GOSDA|nr:hypothetical protein ES288_D04G106600v1 [Gossypium darwinii]
MAHQSFRDNHFHKKHSSDLLMRIQLHLPHLKEGNMTAPPVENAIALHRDWKRTDMNKNIFVVDHYHNKFQDVMHARQNQSIRVEIPDIVFVSSCADLTLSPDAGLCIDTTYGPIFLIADSWESLNGWLDAIRLVYTIYARGKIDVLASIITS